MEILFHSPQGCREKEEETLCMKVICKWCRAEQEEGEVFLSLFCVRVQKVGVWEESGWGRRCSTGWANMGTETIATARISWWGRVPGFWDGSP